MLNEIFRDEYKYIKFVQKTITVPNWPCPHCNIGTLTASSQNLFISEFEHSRKVSRQKEDWPLNVEGACYGKLVCNNPKCKDFVAFIGQQSVDVDFSEDSSGGFEQGFYEHVIPISFYPPLNIIPVGKAYPKEIQSYLKMSFSHFWDDPNGCANKIRGCVEIILDILKIRKYTAKKKPIYLFDRIDLLPPKNIHIRDDLLALKILGNPGSHTGSLTHSDLIDGYEILDALLTKLFQHDGRRIEKLKKEIIKKNKPRNKK